MIGVEQKSRFGTVRTVVDPIRTSALSSMDDRMRRLQPVHFLRGIFPLRKIAVLAVRGAG
ncbi:hypothetical protein CP49_23515 [Bradyrhizobium valentinum]|uniref:Uncharacterized protein n=1 Tax=Bradyrhizobium valentinum TaxID=1518501 RepID=A0A0R3M4P4_9BRAD|nr:hypothetical protein CP49_23515 [Bradyrhizobium valentinum]